MVIYIDSLKEGINGIITPLVHKLLPVLITTLTILSLSNLSTINKLPDFKY